METTTESPLQPMDVPITRQDAEPRAAEPRAAEEDSERQKKHPRDDEEDSSAKRQRPLSEPVSYFVFSN